jgi:cellulose synthase/poly-beta-1,6-N-acetylglucosamine synthase-like glycosyltransferase
MTHPHSTVLVIDAVLRPLGVPVYLAIAAMSYPIALILPARKHTGKIREGTLVQPPATPDEPVPSVQQPSPEAWPSVTVVVPAYNSQETIAACIESLLNLRYPREKLDIIIVDNGSSDNTAAIASRYSVKVLREERCGAAAARNRGIREAKGEYVAFTDSDCQVAPDWLSTLVRTALDSKSDAVGGRIVNAVSTPIARFTEDQRVMNQEDAVRGVMVPFPFIITANALFRRKTLEDVNGFDVAFVDAAAEDDDLGWRLHARGCVFAYAHDAVVYHHHRLSAVGLYFQFHKYARAEVQLCMKHRSRLSRRELRDMLWIRGWSYRRFMKSMLTLPWYWLVNPERARYNWLYLVREMGYMAGRLDASQRFHTFRYFSFW